MNEERHKRENVRDSRTKCVWLGACFSLHFLLIEEYLSRFHGWMSPYPSNDASPIFPRHTIDERGARLWDSGSFRCWIKCIWIKKDCANSWSDKFYFSLLLGATNHSISQFVELCYLQWRDGLSSWEVFVINLNTVHVWQNVVQILPQERIVWLFKFSFLVVLYTWRWNQLCQDTHMIGSTLPTICNVQRAGENLTESVGHVRNLWFRQVLALLIGAWPLQWWPGAIQIL